MESKIYIEENNYYKIDCNDAVWSTDRILDDFHAAGTNLCDVDWIIENEDYLILVEYKNANIPTANHSSEFLPNSDKKINNVVKKYYDSLHYLSLKNKVKSKRYVYILEYPNGDSTSRRMIRNKLKQLLPFKLQENLSESNTLISSVEVLSIDEWNNNITYRKYPITIV